MSGLLTRDQILGAEDLLREEVEVPEWGGKVLVRGLTGTERDAFEAGIISTNGTGRKRNTKMDMQNVRAKLVARVIIGEDGQRLFSDTDVAALGKKSAVALNRVFEVAQRISGITDEDVEVLAKNSESSQSDDSGLG